MAKFLPEKRESSNKVFNYIIQLFGLGIYHSAIEINGLEYSFAYTKDDNSGIFYRLLPD